MLFRLLNQPDVFVTFNKFVRFEKIEIKFVNDEFKLENVWLKIDDDDDTLNSFRIPCVMLVQVAFNVVNENEPLVPKIPSKAVENVDVKFVMFVTIPVMNVEMSSKRPGWGSGLADDDWK